MQDLQNKNTVMLPGPEVNRVRVAFKASQALVARVGTRLESIEDTSLFCQSVLLDILIDTHASV